MAIFVVRSGYDGALVWTYIIRLAILFIFSIFDILLNVILNELSLDEFLLLRLGLLLVIWALRLPAVNLLLFHFNRR